MNTVRGIRFVREWYGKLGQDDRRDADMTMGQRELLVTRGFAEWVEDPKPQPERENNHSEVKRLRPSSKGNKVEQ